MICGVGGQGTILAAHILADVACEAGSEVKVSEIHGMSQRGGSVTTVVRFGDEVFSMMCGSGEADALLSFDALEACRFLHTSATHGAIITNTAIIKPASVLAGESKVPDDLYSALEDAGAQMVDANALAVQAGSARCANIVLLGALSRHLYFDESIWEAKIADRVPPAMVDVNIRAFRIGRGLGI